MSENANTLEDAVKQLPHKGFTQPLLFRYMNSFWVKLDHTAAAISSACIADAFESAADILCHECAVSTRAVVGLRVFGEGNGIKNNGGEERPIGRFLSASIK